MSPQVGPIKKNVMGSQPRQQEVNRYNLDEDQNILILKNEPSAVKFPLIEARDGK
jgi:hypothetical protein